MEALWVDINGIVHILQANTLEDLTKIIKELRQSLGQKEPDAMVVHSENPEIKQNIEKIADIKEEELSDEQRKEIHRQITERIRTDIKYND